MKGIVFNVVEEAVSQEWGEQTWDALLLDCGLEGAYTALGNYPDADLLALARAAAVRLDCSVDDVLRTLGRLTFAPLWARYRSSADAPESMREFLPVLDDVIHPEVLKLYPGASVPRFVLRDEGDQLEMDYLSVRRMCMLAEGLLLGLAEHYGEHVTVDQPRCKERGDDRCTLRIRGAA
jgi:hypothetical protein